jgi:integrase
MALAALEAQRSLTQLQGEAVFQDPRYDQPWSDERAFRRSYWTPVLSFLGIRYRRPYNMRHTYATLMLMAGANHSWCAKQLGHSVDQFQRTYTKWIDGEQNDRELDLIESALAPVRRQAHAH